MLWLLLAMVAIVFFTAAAFVSAGAALGIVVVALVGGAVLGASADG